MSIRSKTFLGIKEIILSVILKLSKFKIRFTENSFASYEYSSDQWSELGVFFDPVKGGGQLALIPKNIGNRNILSGNLIDLKITQNGYAHRFQRTRIRIEQVLLVDLGFDVR